jgi:hypothetical protein
VNRHAQAEAKHPEGADMPSRREVPAWWQTASLHRHGGWLSGKVEGMGKRLAAVVIAVLVFGAQVADARDERS